MLLTEEPRALAGVLVQMGRNTVLLPGLDDDEGFFERMHQHISANPGNVKEEVSGKLVPWPKQAAFLLDMPTDRST